MDTKLFPLYLNQGSRGPAVAALQILLLGLGLNPKIVVDGDYGEQTALGVKKLQEMLGVEADGHFGPKTREALHQQVGGIDVNQIPADVFRGETEAVTPL